MHDRSLLSRLLPSALVGAGLLCLLLSGCGPVLDAFADGVRPPVYGEVEPNDTPWETAVFDPLAPGDHFLLVGNVGVVFDAYDHVGLEALGPMEDRLTLRSAGDDVGADHDLAIWDDTVQGYVLVSNGWGSEQVSFLVDWSGPFQVRVCSPWEGGDWELEVEALPHPGLRTGSGTAPGHDQGSNGPIRTRARWLEDANPSHAQPSSPRSLPRSFEAPGSGHDITD